MFSAPLPLWLALVVGALAGPVIDAGFPDRGLWLLAILGAALVFWALVGRGFWSGFLVGLVAGGTFWGTHISWLTAYLGPVPWLGLSGIETVFFAVGAGMIAVVLTHGNRQWPSRWRRLGFVPLIVAGLWTGREAVNAVWPYGGFAWGRLALSQSESPFGSLAAWVGISGLSFLLAWIAVLALQLMRESTMHLLTRVLIAVAVITVLVAIPNWPAPTQGTTTIAAVQGNSNVGLFARFKPGEILNDHVAATMPILGRSVDMVVWPENAADVDPSHSSQSAAVLDSVSASMNAPLIVGTITQSGDLFFNSSLEWVAGRGIVDQYDKIHPVPFAEYVPNREFFSRLAPSLIGLVTREYAVGTRSPNLTVGSVNAGVLICFDVADDAIVSQSIVGGAQVILAQTNNADFGHTDESVQQLAIARLRAIETGRTVVNVSTVGTSAIIAPDGATINRLPTFTTGSMIDTVPLSSTRTPASYVGRPVELLVSVVGLIGLFGLCIEATAQKSRRRSSARRASSASK